MASREGIERLEQRALLSAGWNYSLDGTGGAVASDAFTVLGEQQSVDSTQLQNGLTSAGEFESGPSAALVNNTARGTIVVSEFIHPLEDWPTPHAHSSTIVELSDGSLVSSWFGGTAEKNPDTGIWVSRFDGLQWSTPVEVATGAEDEDQDYAVWNPVLFESADGVLHLFYKVGPTPRTWWGRQMTSTDGGETWSASVRLPDPILGPIKNPPVQLANGTIISPSSTESDEPVPVWQVHFEISNDNGQTWQKVGPVASNGFNAIQPTILVHPDGRLQALCRSQQDVIVETWSNDNGQTWSPLAATSLPNPSAGIDGTTLSDGRFALAYNPTTTGRTPLVVALSHDGVNWDEITVLEDTPGQFSYPTLIQTDDGRLHVTYSWKIEAIRHAVIELENEFVVNTSEDSVDVNPGDGVAEDALGRTSVRAAIMEANALDGRETILLAPDAYTLSLTGAESEGTNDLDITGKVALVATGGGLTTIDADGIDRVLQVSASGTLLVDGIGITGGNTSGSGGGIFNDGGTVRLVNTTVFSNTAANGGGIANTGAISIDNSTISGNTGGGIENASGGALALSRSTVADNTDDAAAGVDNAGNTLLNNTIVAGNTGTAENTDLAGSFVSNGFNVIGKAGAGVTGLNSSDIVGTTGVPIDPKLAPLANNGGTTLTHALKPGSVAIDAGANNIADLSGNGNTASVVGDVTAGEGVLGLGANFPGGVGNTADDYIAVDLAQISPSEIPTTGMTVAAWVKVEDTGNTHEVFASQTGAGEFITHVELRNDNTVRFTLRDNSGDDIINFIGSSFSFDTWFHIAATYDQTADEVLVYINGSPVFSGPSTLNAAIGSDWGLGARIGSTTNNARPFTGQMDEFYLYTRALSSAEIGTLATIPAIPTGTPQVAGGLSMYYSFDDIIASPTDQRGAGFPRVVHGAIDVGAIEMTRTKVIDDGDPGFAIESGSWGSGTAGALGDNRNASQFNGSKVASWTFDGLTPGVYRVSATWAASPVRATDAPFTVFDGANPLATVDVNQQLAPSGVPGVNNLGVSWQDLGNDLFRITSSTLKVELSNDANGYVMADAVRIERIGELPPPPVIVDDGDPGFAIESGAWGTGNAGAGGDNRNASIFGGTKVARWSFDNLTPGVYRVSTTWVPSAARATDAPFTLFDGFTPITTVDVNQQLAPSGSPDLNDLGVPWQDLAGNFQVTGDKLFVKLTNIANGYVMADAIRIERVADFPQVIDDGDAGFAIESGSWGTGNAGAFGDNRNASIWNGNKVASWTFTGLTAGTYRVSATWAASLSRATDAPYTIFDGATSLTTIDVNQQQAPDDFTEGGINWEDLTTVLITGDTLVVQLSNDANNYVMADAIRIQRVS